MRFEALDLLDVKRLEITKSGISLEAVQCLCDAIDRRFGAAFRLFEEDEIFTLDALVNCASILHVFSSFAGITIKEGSDSLAYAWLRQRKSSRPIPL